ncbi:MAG: thiolase family protein [Thermoleophilaceae bacterium]|nr:thiolase family protein [Thermoleophilaceae bacterium]
MSVDFGDVYVIDALRTPVGRYGGGLATVRPDDLAAHTIKAVVERTGLPTADITDVYFGCANQAGEDNRNVARMASLLAGLPNEVPGATVNRLCASGLEAIGSAARGVVASEGDLYLAGGVESMTRAPYVFLKHEAAFSRAPMEVADTTIGWRFVNEQFLGEPDENGASLTDSMGETAENVAQRYGVSREDQDAFAVESHRRATSAWDAGIFDREVIPMSVAQRKGDPLVVARDEGIRADSSLEKLAKLRPAFRAGGTVTAGNSSQINDGAACLVIGTLARAQALGIEPLARIIATASAGVEPAYMGAGPIPAVRKLLERTGKTIDDIDLVELNEAFASQVLACQRELGIADEKLNVNGGGIAIGHPLGCTGARLTGTLAYELRRRGLRYGIVTMCIGVGMGLAALIENPAA